MKKFILTIIFIFTFGSACLAAVELDYMEYASDATAQAAYVSNASTGADLANTKFLLHLDGSDASTTLTEELGKTITAQGDAQLDTAQKKFGTASLLLDGDDYALINDHADLAFGTNAWSLSCWIRFSSVPTGYQEIYTQATTDTASYYRFGINVTAGVFRLVWQTAVGGNYYAYVLPNLTINADTWYHVEFGRSGANFYIFLDGQTDTLTEAGSPIGTDTLGDINGKALIGAFNSESPNSFFAGWIDDFRIVNGTLVHSSEFTPPTFSYRKLECYSESTIKNQGSYSLESFSNTAAVNKTLTRTPASSFNLSNFITVKFDIYASRTGSNIKVGLHDSGGTTTETTPNVTDANTWQTVTWDISGVSPTNKDVVDQIIVTVANADADNTFYIDNMYAETSSGLVYRFNTGFESGIEGGMN